MKAPLEILFIKDWTFGSFTMMKETKLRRCVSIVDIDESDTETILPYISKVSQEQIGLSINNLRRLFKTKFITITIPDQFVIAADKIEVFEHDCYRGEIFESNLLCIQNGNIDFRPYTYFVPYTCIRKTDEIVVDIDYDYLTRLLENKHIIGW
jgi:hypothetical protein